MVRFGRTCQTVAMRRSRAPRVARGAVAASIATFAALLSHVVAGGEVPGWIGIAAPWILALAVCTLLAGRTLSLVRLSVSVVVSQLLFHTLFVMGAPSAPSASTSTGHDHAAMTLLPAASSTSVAAWCADPAMWGAHAAAAAATIAVLYRAERAVRMLLFLAAQVRAWARRVAARCVPTVPAALLRRPARRRIIARAWMPRSAPHLRVLRPRGPPPIPAF